MKRACCFFGALLSLSLVTPAFAAEAQSVHTSTQRPPYVYIEGADVLFFSEEEGRMGRVDPLTYSGVTYIPLTTVSAWTGMDTTWDKREGSVTFSTNGKTPLFYNFAFLQDNGLDFLQGREQFTTDRQEGVDAQLYSETVLTVNGQDKGFVSSLLFREELYLPLNDVAGLMGKQYLRFGSDIHLYDTPTQKELTEAKNYLSPIPEHLKTVRDLVTGDAPRTEEEFLDRMRTVQRELMAVWEAPVPSFGPMAPYVEDIRYQTLLVLNDKVDFYLPEGERSGTAQALSDHLGGYVWKRTAGLIPNTFLENWEEFTAEMLTNQYNVTTYFMELERAYQTAWSFMEEVRAALPDDAFAVDSAAYTDADQIVYEKAVTVLSQLGVISGKEDGSFDPQGLVTRAECAKLLVALRCGGNPERIPAHEGPPAFSDITGHWAEDYISYGKKSLRLLTGRGDGTFDPDAPVTGLELAKMALGALGYDPVAYQLTGRNWDSQTNRLALMVCDPSLYEELGEDVAVSEPITREVAAQILYNTLFNGVIEVTPSTAVSTGEVTNTFTPMRDKEGQDIPFYSIYIDATKWDVLSAK